MSMNKPKKLELVFHSADRNQTITAEWVEHVINELRRLSNIGRMPSYFVAGSEASVTFGAEASDILASQESNGQIIPTVGRFFRDYPNDYDLPQPDYDVFTDTLTCNITIK